MRAVSISGFAVCFSVLLLVSGCGGSTVTVDAIPPKLARPTDTRATAKEVKVAVAPFQAARDKNKGECLIGEAKTGFFNVPGPIVSRESPEQIVAAVVKEALGQHSGEIRDIRKGSGCHDRQYPDAHQSARSCRELHSRE